MNATWLTECVQSLGTARSARSNLKPFQPCDDDLASHLPKPFSDPRDFVSQATLRLLAEIYQQADLHYRLHSWAALKMLGREANLAPFIKDSFLSLTQGSRSGNSV